MEFARFGPVLATDPVATTNDLGDLTSGFWALVTTFEGATRAVRFATVERDAGRPQPGDWVPLERAWSSSLDATAYRAGVVEVRRRIAAGTVYQVNLCRVLAHDLPEEAYLPALGPVLARGNPAPHEATIHVPSVGLDVVSASPETFLSRHGSRIVSRPIKGTAARAEEMLAKDYAENVMIADLVRNDLSHVCRPGTVAVEGLCRLEHHPGLVHLVTQVAGELRPDVGWPEIMAATFPPGSVSGAPKSSALRAITDLEPEARGPYCGAIGWVDADSDRAELAVGIRTFWAETVSGQRQLRFGTGSGITWGSDPDGEWQETQLKAARLVGLASGRVTA